MCKGHHMWGLGTSLRKLIILTLSIHQIYYLLLLFFFVPMFSPKTVDPSEPKDTRLDEETSTLGMQ